MMAFAQSVKKNKKNKMKKKKKSDKRQPKKKKKHNKTKKTNPKPFQEKPMKPIITFTATAYAKIQRLLQLDTEAGAFGLSKTSSPLHILDIGIPHQTVSGTSVEFDDDKIAQYTDEMYMAGFEPGESSRIWIHTHPAGINGPSGTDEDTFAKIFGNYDWGAMVIFPKNSTPYARIKTTKPVPMEALADVQVAYPATDIEDLIKTRIKKEVFAFTYPKTPKIAPADVDAADKEINRLHQLGYISTQDHDTFIGTGIVPDPYDDDEKNWQDYIDGKLTYAEYQDKIISNNGYEKGW